MATVHVIAHSLTTEQVRAALVLHSKIVRQGGIPDTIPTAYSREMGRGGAFVCAEGADYWRFTSVGVTPQQAAALCDAIAQT